MTAIPVTKVLPPVRTLQRIARNGLVPNASTYANATSDLNHAVLYRRKLFGSFSGRRVDQSALIFPDTTGAGPDNKWRWRNKTGHGTRALRFVVKMALSRGASDSRVRFAVTVAGGATTYTNYIHYGITEETALDVPSEIGKFHTDLEVDPDTTYEIVMLAYDFARPVSCMIYELAEDPDTTVDHYTAPGHPVGSPILDGHRGDLLPAWTALMADNANAGWHWCVDEAPVTRTSATYANVMDQTITAHAASSPGVTIDLTGRNTYARATVPFVWAVYASGTGASGTAKVKLVNAGGDVVAITTITTAGWYATTVNLATAEQKLDLMLACDGISTTSLYASALYEGE